MKKMENRIAKRIYVREYEGSHSIHHLQKRWIDPMKDCLKKKKFGCQASKENGEDL